MLRVMEQVRGKARTPSPVHLSLGPRKRAPRGGRFPALTQRFQDEVDEVDLLVLQSLVGLHPHVHVAITMLIAYMD